MSNRTFDTQVSVIQDRYKICFCGKYGVGKTTIFHRLRNHVRTVNRNNALEGGPPDSAGIGIDSITYVLPELNSEVSGYSFTFYILIFYFLVVYTYIFCLFVCLCDFQQL